jgi:hypothetical protein
LAYPTQRIVGFEREGQAPAGVPARAYREEVARDYRGWVEG